MSNEELKKIREYLSVTRRQRKAIRPSAAPKPGRIRIVSDGNIIGTIRQKAGLKLWEYHYPTGTIKEVVPAKSDDGLEEVHVNPDCLIRQSVNLATAEAAFAKLFKNVK